MWGLQLQDRPSNQVTFPARSRNGEPAQPTSNKVVAVITLLFHRATQWTRKSTYTGHIPHPSSPPRPTPSMESYPSYTLPHQSYQDFSAFVPHTASLSPLSDGGELQSSAFLEGTDWSSDIATVIPGIYQPHTITSPAEEFNARPFEFTPQPADLTSLSTPGFIALNASQPHATSARRIRKPREFVPHLLISTDEF